MKAQTFTTAVFLIYSIYTQGQNCASPTSKVELDINNVRALLLNGGDMFWDMGGTSTSGYEVPKGNNLHSLFASALWLGGKDSATGNVLLVSETYRQLGRSFWPGPLQSNLIGVLPEINSTQCNLWDKHFKINKQDIENFKSDFEKGLITSPSQINEKILNWPSKNNPHITDGRDMNNDLAPFQDVNNDGIYNPMDGDYPQIMGHQSVWWVMNDVGNDKMFDIIYDKQTYGIGLEIQVEAFAYASCNEVIDHTTFYRYKLTNKGYRTIEDTYVGFWSDYDIGYYFDDYAGSDVERGMFYGYNGDNDDDGISGYGANPPAIGFDFVKGIKADANDSIDNNRNGIVDEQEEEIKMSNFLYYNNNGNNVNGNPSAINDFYNYLKSMWKDNSYNTYDGKDGTHPDSVRCHFMFPGSSDQVHYWGTNGTPVQPWSEESASNAPGDRRGIGSMGPFTFKPGDVQEFVVAIVWARASEGGNMASLQKLLEADDIVQSAWDNGFSDCPLLSTPEQDVLNKIKIFPNPFTGEFKVEGLKLNVGEGFGVKLYNLLGREMDINFQITNHDIIIDGSKLERGVYLLEIGNGNEKWRSRVIKN